MDQTESRRLAKGLSGVAGEYFVTAELTRRGYIASITLRNTRDVDILAASSDAERRVGIQVKTNQGSSKGWVLTKKAESLEADGLFYVFVNLNGESGVPSYHIVPSAVVAEWCRRDHFEWLKAPGRGGRPHRDSSVRKFWDRNDEWLSRWDVLGLEGMP